jgi:hypothetical protein
MVRHDLKSMSVHELVVSDRAEPVMRASEFPTQHRRIQRLNEYCNQALREIRASLDRTQCEAVKMASRERNRDRMRHLLVLPAALARCLAALFCVLIMVMSGAALAQTTGTANPSSDPAQPSVKEDVPPGGCMPIGLTASGEIVFPIQCKEFIERERGKAVEQKPAAAAEKATAAPSEGVAAVEQKPAAAEEKAAAAPSEGVAPENSKPAQNPDETAVLPKRVRDEPRKRTMSQNGCQHYRTYDPTSGTYRGYDGRHHSC